MSRFRRIEFVEPYSPPTFIRETSILAPKTLAFPSFFDEEPDFSFALDLLDPTPRFSSFEVFDTDTDLIEIKKAPLFCSYSRIHRRVEPGFEIQRLCDRVSVPESTFDRLIEIKKTPSFCSYSRIHRRVEPEFEIQRLCDRVSVLESTLDRLINPRFDGGDRKYAVTAEIKGPVERKYKWRAEIKDGNEKEEEKDQKGRKYKWVAEIERKNEEQPISGKYTFEASSGHASEGNKAEKKQKKHKKEKKGECETRIVEIEEPVPADHRAVVLRQAFARRAGAVRNERGKRKQLSPQDAALIIQVIFRAYLIRRSKALRALRDLAVAKTKLKEIRAFFNNFSYRSRVAREPDERQRFSEKIIVLLLTVDAIEGADLMVRAARKSMVDELEAMLDVVDPQPPEKSLSMKRRTFDMPDGVIQKEIAEGVAQVVQMLGTEGG